MRPWAMPLRTWLTIAWLGATVAIKGPQKLEPTPWERNSEQKLTEAVQLIRSHPDRWGEPAFQRQLSPILESGGHSVALIGADGRLLFRTGSVINLTVKADGT